MQRMMRREPGRRERAAADAGIGEQRGAQWTRTDRLRHVPGAVEIARREHTVGEDHGNVVGEQQHFARPGVAAGGKADERAFVGERTGAMLAQHAHLKLAATRDDARGERSRIGKPGVEVCRCAGQGGTGFPAGFLA